MGTLEGTFDVAGPTGIGEAVFVTVVEERAGGGILLLSSSTAPAAARSYILI